MANTIDFDKIAAGLNPEGINPETEKKAMEYGRRAWTMDFAPVLKEVMKDEFTLEFQGKVQRALKAHKVAVIEASLDKAAEKEESGLIW